MTIDRDNSLLPTDGRFGSGPSKVRAEQLAAISAAGSPMGTSHRQAGVREVVGRIRTGLRELFSLPEGYEVILGNGGATALWDAITFCLVETRAQCAVIGEFSGKAARAVERAPWLEAEIRRAEPGQMIECESRTGIDTYIYAHNETSTGATTPLRRYGGAEALTVVDGTSIAGGLVVDIDDVDFYYFSPQKCFGADGGLWLAFASPAAQERISRLTGERWVPDFLNLQIAVTNSVKDQTYNTPSLANLLMLDNQIQWMLGEGGLREMARRSKVMSSLVYEWADRRSDARPFIEPSYRSPVVTTIDFDDSIDTKSITAQLRTRGVVDIEPYRSLGRNQLRIATFPSIEIDDVRALLATLNQLLN